jgi:hypothetical protein
MKKVYQTIIDQNKGNCMQAVMASLFNKDLEEVPNFIEFKEWFHPFHKFIEENGYKYKGMLHNKNYTRLNCPSSECFKEEKWHRPSIMTKKSLYKYGGVDGIFYAGVLSPKFFSWQKQTSHAVLIDRDFNIVHDPSPAYKDIIQYPLTSVLGYNGIIDVYLIEKA